jgi:hypothetical protein
MKGSLPFLVIGIGGFFPLSLFSFICVLALLYDVTMARRARRSLSGWAAAFGFGFCFSYISLIFCFLIRLGVCPVIIL